MPTDLEMAQAATILSQRTTIQDLHRKLAAAREHEEAAWRVAHRMGASGEDVAAQIEHDGALRRLAAAQEDSVSRAHGVLGSLAGLVGRLRAAPADAEQVPVAAVVKALDGILAGRKNVRLPFPPEPAQESAAQPPTDALFDVPPTTGAALSRAVVAPEAAKRRPVQVVQPVGDRL